MNYKIEWEIYSTRELIINNEWILFDWFYIIDNIEIHNNWFNWVLRNYFKYKFEFYFIHNSNIEIDYPWSYERRIRFLVQDNLEIELSIYWLLKDTSIISWVRSWITEYWNNDKTFNNLWYSINKNYCWNYYKKSDESIKDNSNNFYWYKFRLSNLEIIPWTSIISNYLEIIKDKQLYIQLNNEEILTQINYYNSWIFLENHWFMSDAFNYFYKIIELEEQKEWKDSIINKADFETKISEFLSENKTDTINLDNFNNKISDLKKKNWENIREKIYKKYKLSWDINSFRNLRNIRWKFSHSSWINYVNAIDYENWKKFVLELILNKLSNF